MIDSCHVLTTQSEPLALTWLATLPRRPETIDLSIRADDRLIAFASVDICPIFSWKLNRDSNACSGDSGATTRLRTKRNVYFSIRAGSLEQG